MKKISEWRKRQEILWWQRASTDYLKYGDTNTHWFHFPTNMQRARDHIDGQLNETQQLCTDPEEIASIVSIYFASLFSTSGTSTWGRSWNAWSQGL